MANITPEEIKALVSAKIKGQGTAVDMGSVLPAILNGLADNITDVESSIIDIGNENKIHFVKTTHIDYPTISKSKEGDIAILYDSQKWMFTFWACVQAGSWVQMNSIPIYAQKSDLPGEQSGTMFPNPGSLALVGNTSDGFKLYMVSIDGSTFDWVEVGLSGGGGGGGDDDSIFINRGYTDLPSHEIGPWSYFIEATQLGITEEEFISICKGVSSVSLSNDKEGRNTQPVFMKSFKMGSSYDSETNLTYGYGYAGIKNPERPGDGLCYVCFAMKEDQYSPEYNEYMIWTKEY